MTYAQPPVEPTPATPPAPAKQRNTLGLIALALAVVGFIFACIPGALIVGWILLPIAFILSIVSFFMKGAKWPSITALILSIVGTIIGFIVFFAVAATSFDEAFTDDTTVVESSEGPVAEDDAAAEEEPATEAGTRENPYPLGTTVSSDEWEVTINSVTLAANDAVMGENQFNEAPEAGNEYILVNATMVYIGTDPDGGLPAFVNIEYVTATGETVEPTFAVAPDELDSMSTLYEGGTVTGNIAMQVPSEGIDTGVLAVRPGMLADTVFFAVT